MFFSPSAIIAFFFTLFFVGQVAAFPIAIPMRVRAYTATHHRSYSPTILQAAILKRQAPPVQEAVKSDGNVVSVYKRQAPDVQEAAKSDGNGPVPYKRQVPDVQEAAKSDGNGPVPYKRSLEIPIQLAVRSVDGVIELY